MDTEIAILFGKQRESGAVEGRHLDGNFVRTALSYARYKTAGLTAHPWREDLLLGAAMDRERGALYVYLDAGAAWEGTLRFDPPRHRTIWDLPFEYPRLNGEPEWFTVDPDGAYSVSDLSDGRWTLYAGKDLARGMPVRLGEGDPALRLKVTAPRLADPSTP